jgi:hypothetical protein
MGVLPVSKWMRSKHDLKEIKEMEVLKSKYKVLYNNSKDLADKIKYSVMLDNIENPLTSFDKDDKNTISIFKKTFLSNFHSVKIVYEGIEYKSVEHAYIATKFKGLEIDDPIAKQLNKECFMHINDTLVDTDDHGEDISKENVLRFLRESKGSARDSVMVSKELVLRGFIRKDWPANRVKTMIELLLIKFEPNTKLAEELLATGDKYLIEGNYWGDVFWGYDTNLERGNNLLGRALMYIRDNILKEQENTTDNVCKKKMHELNYE